MKIEKLENDLLGLAGGFLFNCRGLTKEQFLTLLNMLEEEKVSLMGQVEAMHGNLDAEIKKSVSLYEQIGKQKVKIARLEAKNR